MGLHAMVRCPVPVTRRAHKSQFAERGFAGGAALFVPVPGQRYRAQPERQLTQRDTFGREEIAVLGPLALDEQGLAGLDGHQVRDPLGPGGLDDVVAVVFEVVFGGAFKVGAAPIVRAAHGRMSACRLTRARSSAAVHEKSADSWISRGPWPVSTVRWAPGGMVQNASNPRKVGRDDGHSRGGWNGSQFMA